MTSPLLDTATGVALNIGTNNATGINLNQNTTIASGKTLTVTGSGATSLGGALTVTGTTSYLKGTDFSTTGSSNDVAFSVGSLIRLTGASAQTITGIANGTDGRLFTNFSSACESFH